MAFYLIKYIENTEHNKKTTSIYGEDREAPEKKNIIWYLQEEPFSSADSYIGQKRG
jgi:hypothetical protein